MNLLINTLSLGLLLTFGFSYLLKLYLLRKRKNLNANVLGNRNKSRKTQKVERILQISTFAWILIWIFEILSIFFNIENVFKLWSNFLISALGLITITIGVVFFIAAATTMKNSWRVGIDKSTKSKLITEGIYKYSRNPAFVGFYFMFIGLFLLYSDAISGFTMIINIFAMHKLVLEEEKHLEESFGREYNIYKDKTPRYMFFN
jgi:protein-S-isoprenylcysteine O-methyltransferase Ste14